MGAGVVFLTIALETVKPLLAGFQVRTPIG